MNKIPLISVLILSALFVVEVKSLQCYVCEEVFGSGFSCSASSLNIQNCTESVGSFEDFSCLSVSVNNGSFKGCIPTAYCNTTAHIDEFQAHGLSLLSVSCCSSDLCNGALSSLSIQNMFFLVVMALVACVSSMLYN